MADYAIHDTTLTGIADTIRKKDGTQALIDPAEYADRINLMGILEGKTASGSIVTFSDGADDVPVKSCEVALSASLDGYSSVDVVQCGKNLLNPSLLSLFSSSKYVGTSNYNSEGAIDVFGGENYVISFAFTITDGRVRYWDAEGNQISSVSLSNKQSLALTAPSNAVKMSFYAGQNTAQTSVTDFEPMLEVGSTATAYEPYVAPTTHTAQLGRTIYGGSVDVVNGEGQETYPTIQVGELTFAKVATHTFRCNNFDRVFGNGKYNIYSSQFATYTQGHSTASNIASLEQGNDNTIFLNGGSGTFYISTDSSFDDKSVEDFLTAYGNAILIYETTTPTDFTFEPVEINTRLGNNTMWSDGDMSVTYRASGTVTKIAPLLMSKAITENGTYSASDDGVDGYDAVVVNVAMPVIEPIMGNNVFVSQSGVSGTDVERTARTFNITKDGKIIFADGSYGYTNTGSNNGFIDIRHNDVSVVKQYLTTNTNTPITIPDIDVENGDTIAVVVGFDSNHSSCNFQLYSAMTMVSEEVSP